ncbi:GNAT family N-acetyltransferase [Ekhidna sp.]|uniref:GNAT family N-acetyltransferase n=1 Tax=Ekhidna sp. TaxID=2608089 RepID=UPI0032EB3B61
MKSHENQDIARTLVRKLADYFKSVLDCKSAWVATVDTNIAAQKAFVATAGRRQEEGCSVS